ncbi:MAG: DUF11 domain-containing protein [Microbacteriaceae bacterium]|nr:DUF11 domain-containing protein [Microbacteriaceae bacterium]
MPTSTVTAATSSPLLGEDVALTVTFDNTDTTDTGYGPYVDLVFDSGGADGDDGVSFGSAAYLGAPLAPLAVFDCTGTAQTHPLTGASVACPVGSQIIVLQLPFGSFTPGQPVAPVSVNASVSGLADVGISLGVTATGGFAYGDSPTGTTPIVGTTDSATLVPEVVRFTKRVVAPEEETATGPNYPRQYVLEVDIADGQTVNDLTITDRLPDSYVYLSSTSTLPTLLDQPTVGAVVDPADNTLEYTDASPTVGTSAAVDASMTFDYYISDLDFAGDPVLDPSTGDDVETVNDGEASGTVDPLDPRDADAPFVLDTPVVDPDNDDDARIEAKSIAIQKSVSTVTEAGATGTTPGDVLEYTISGQVSDYYSFGDIDVNDVLGDGQTFDTSFTPTLTVTEGGAATAPGLAGFFTVDESARTTCGDGTTAIDFAVSDADAAGSGNGILTGGLVPAIPTGATTFEITFRATIDDAYTCTFSGTGPLNPNDFVTNDVSVTGEVLDNATQAPQAVPQFESDDSATRLDVEPISVQKSVWGRNGVVGGLGDPAQFAAGDTISYRLSLTVPSSDFESLRIGDFLPLPTLVATGLTQEGAACTATTAPALDSWCYGPLDTMSSAPGFVDPTTSFDTTANSITWDFGTQEIPDNQARVIELIFTLEISDAAFRDGLFLTNQVQSTEDNSFNTESTSPAIVQIELTQPELNIDKGVVARSTNPGSALSAPINPTGVVFDPVATAAACPDYSGTVSSDNLANGAPDANATGLDARDIVRYAIVVENTGNGLNGAFDVTINDVVPAGFEVPAAGLDLCVTNGAGTPIPNTTTGFFSGAPTASPLGTGSITLADTTTGSLAPADPTSGDNVAVITYNLALVATTGANTATTALTNTANVTNYSATEGGPSFLPVTPAADLVDTAFVATKPLTVAKTRTDTSQASTSGANVAIGEEVEYTVTVTVPEGTSRDVRLVDTLDTGLVMSRPPTAAVLGADLTATAQAAPTVSVGGRVLTFNFGDITNSGATGSANTVDAADQITFTYWAVVTNVAANQDGQVRRNSAAISYASGATGTARTTATAQVPVNIVEPALQVAKSASVPTIDAGDRFTYTIVVNHRTTAPVSNADAFDVALTDTIPAGLTYVGGTLASTGAAPTTLTESSGTIDATWASFPQASTTTITFDVIVSGSYNPVAPIDNTASITYTGLPGSPTTAIGGGEERTGAGGLNDYATSNTATVTPIAPSLNKALVATDQTTTTDPNVTIGEILTYDITVDLPEGDIDGFVVTDVLPPGLQYVAASGEVFTTNGAAVPTPGLAADFDGTLGALAITGGTGDGDDVVFTFGATTVNPDDPADDTDNTIVVRINALVLDVAGNVGFTPGQTTLNNTGSVQIDGGPVVNSAVVATPVVEPRLTIQKSFDPTSASQGDTVDVVLVVENTGLSTAHDVIIDDILQSEFDDATAAEGTTPAGFAYSRSGSTVTYTGGDIAPGATISFRFAVDLDNPLPVGTLVQNTATVTQNTTLPGTVAGERDEPDVASTAQLNTVGPDLQLSKDDGVTVIAPGAQTTYDLVITNVGGFAATGVFIDDTLPTGTTLVSVGGDAACSDGGSPSAGVQRINVSGSIAASGDADDSVTCQITIAITAPAAAGTGGYLNTATVTDDGVNGADPTPGNNTAQDNNTITGLAPDLVVTKDDGETQLAPGQTTTYRVTVTNVGNIGVTNVMVTDTLPAGLSFAGCTPISGTVSVTCSEAASVVTITYASIAGGGGSASFDVEATVDQPVAAGNETVINSVTVQDDGANGTDPTPGNNTDTDTDDIVATPDMVVVKSHTEPNVAPGGLVNYRLDVRNAGLQNASGVIVTDTVDAQMTIDCTSATPTPTSCDPGTGVITWGPGLADSAGSTPGEFVAGGTLVLTYQTTAGNPLLAGTTQFVNDVTVADDGASGADPTPANNIYQDTIPLAANAPDLNIVKDDGLTTVTPGQTYTYTLTVTNNGNIAATGVTIDDTLPAGIEFDSCSDSCDSSALPAVTWTLPGSIAGAGGQATVTLTVQVTDPAASGLESITNVATVADDGTNGADPTPGNNTDDDTDTLDAAPILDVAKDDGETERDAGETFDYTITVSNTGDQAATGVTVTDTLPDALSAVSCPATPTPCTIDAGAGTVTWNVGDLNGGAPGALGSSVTLTLTVLVDDLPSGVDDFTNSVRAVDDGTNTGGVPVEDTDTDTDTVNAEPDLQVTKTDNETTVQPGDTLTYDIVITNVGTQAATGVSVTDTLPAGVTFVSCSASCDDTALPTLTWTSLVEDVAGSPADPLAFDAGGQATLTVVVTVDDPATSGLDTLTNSVTVADDGTNGADPTPGNNSDDDVDTLDAAPDLQITKTDGVESVTDGQSVTYQITFSNVGNQDALGVVITDTLAAATSFASCSNGCDSSAAPTISWNVGDLAPGDGGTYTITVDVADPVPAGTRTIVNNVTITDDGTNGPDSDPTNNDDDDTDTYGIDLAVTKTDGQTTAIPGEDLTYTITVTNNGPTTITEFTLDENLPDALNFVTFIPSAGDYDPVTGLWTGIGDFAESDTLTLTVSGTVSADATGSLVNSVTVTPPTDVPDTDPTNNDADDTDTLDPRSNLAITKTISQETVARGDNATFTISVTNRGPSTAVGIVVTDPLPSALNFVGAAGTDWTCTHASGTVTCELGVPLVVGGTASFELVATVVGAEGTSFTNTATVELPGGLGVDSDPTDTAGGAIPEAPTPDTNNPLPRTGSEILGILAIGLSLLLSGIILTGIRRRPRTRNAG